MKNLLSLLMLVFLSCLPQLGCRSNNGSLSESNQAAEHRQVGNHQVIVCNLDLLKDTITVALSDFTEELQIVKLDERPEALVQRVHPPIIGNQYILVAGSYWLGQIPHRLFDISGKFIANVGGIGKGPGEYSYIYEELLDEENNRIYLSQMYSDAILVYDLKGKPLPSIPLPQRISRSTFRINQGEGIVTVFIDPDSEQRRAVTSPYIAWSQDMSGKVINGIPTGSSIKCGISTMALPVMHNNTKDLDILITVGSGCQDTLYHYDIQGNTLVPQFTIDFKGGDVPFHFYCELPHHYLCYMTQLIPGAAPHIAPTHSTPRNILIEKGTLKGSYFKLVNDFLGNIKINRPDYYFKNGYYAYSYDPAELIEDLEDALQNNDIPADMREKLTDLRNSIKETDNNYILYAKLKQ